MHRPAPSIEDVDAQNAEVDRLLRERNLRQPPTVTPPETVSERAHADAAEIGLPAATVDFYAEPPQVLSSRSRDNTGIDVKELDLSDEERAQFGFPPRRSERKAGAPPPAAKPDFLVLSPRERLSVAGELADAFVEFAKSPRATRLPMPPPEARSLVDIAKGVDPLVKIASEQLPNGNRRNTITMPDGRKATLVEEPGGVLQLDAGRLEEGKSGGAALYAIVNTYAMRNGLKALPDRQGLTEINKTRRTEQQAASAIRTETTQHLIPDITQTVAGFERGGNDRDNTGALIIKGMLNTLQAVPELAMLRYNPETAKIEWTDGTVATNEDIDALAATDAAREIGVGRSTIKRAVLGATWVRAIRGGERGRVLGQYGREQVQRLDAATSKPSAGAQATIERALYSRRGMTDGRQETGPGSNAGVDAGTRGVVDAPSSGDALNPGRQSLSPD